ncbi:peptidase family T4 protein [Metarhizium acridum CQMa 102]|uniref:Peptidase family T4 protein n=1 Tax=Metarhizium acridum (strain CQMa 102) TaxID=655827 RepID=E9DX02_METAQ|nr:peptidase family T4 protein [Metarhizium acridum CQMa 102]EFY91865.1 peptidase family T4 protein [Metarhizium acridum CQMa 102]
MAGTNKLGRDRIRNILPDIYLGRWPTGRLNSITDVPGVLVHTQSIEPDSDVHTGVTTILPREDWHKFSSFAGLFRFNGCGEMTGSHWLNETGLLCSPIIITATSSVGEGYRGVTEYVYRHHRQQGGEVDLFLLPVIAETYDGFLSDPARFAVTPEHVIKGIQSATADAVPEGNTGGGTGMICHRFKGGTGSSSRIVKGYSSDGKEVDYTVGVLVQANYGLAETLCIDGVPVGRILQREGKLSAKPADVDAPEPRKDGSIIIIVSTDAPLIPIQLQRLATRATVGLGKVGGYGNNNSGDIFLAFSTANKVPFGDVSLQSRPGFNDFTPAERVVRMSDNDTMNGLFEAAADATEEAIYNAMFMAESMTGYKGRHVPALDLDDVKRIVEKKL